MREATLQKYKIAAEKIGSGFTERDACAQANISIGSFYRIKKAVESGELDLNAPIQPKAKTAAKPKSQKVAKGHKKQGAETAAIVSMGSLNGDPIFKLNPKGLAAAAGLIKSGLKMLGVDVAQFGA